MVKKQKANQTGVKTVKANNISIDIMESNILTRLPVKTLIRFTAVCKSWYAIIYNPYFINAYRQVQKKYFNNLLLVDYRHGNRDNSIVVTDSCSMEQLSSFNYNCYSFEPLEVVGVCDGIVCVCQTSFNMSHISLWNPALRINKIITSYDIRVTFRSNPKHFLSRLCVGFGYLNRTNDYKVVKFINETWTIKHVEIYSLTSDSWKKIELDGASQLLKDPYSVEQFGVYHSSCLGGAYCWLALKQVHNGVSPLIIAFDMEDEVFKEMTLPCETGNHSKGTLVIYKDSLAVIDWYSSDASYPFSSMICNIWVMKEYGDCMSWTKLYTFDSQHPIESFVGFIETELMLLHCYNIMTFNKVIIEIDIGKTQKKTTSSIKGISCLTKARMVSSFYGSLALLKGVHSKNSCIN